MRRLAVVLAALAALTGCGKAGDFSGAAEVPDGYEKVSQGGVSFWVPPGLRREESPGEDGEVEVRYMDARASGAYVPYVSFRVRPGKGAEFEGYVRSLVTVFEALGDAKVQAADVKVPGADRARRLDVEAPPKPGGNRSKIRSTTIVVERDGALVSLSAGAPEDREDRIDHEAVVGSFRLAAGS